MTASTVDPVRTSAPDFARLDEHAAPLHTVPHAAAVVREQFRAVGDAVRRELTVVGGVMGLLLLGVVVARAETGFTMTEMIWPVVFAALLAPLAVWKGDEPHRRAYFWALPVDRGRHTLAKVFAGWGWMMGLVAVYLLWAVATAFLTGGHVSSGAEPPRGVDLALGGRGWMWLVPFAAATAAYLAGSIVALATDHPWRWFAGAFFGTGIVISLKIPGGERVGEAVLTGRYGMETLVTGTPINQLPDAAAWGMAALLWIALTLAGVLAAALRHQER